MHHLFGFEFHLWLKGLLNYRWHLDALWAFVFRYNMAYVYWINVFNRSARFIEKISEDRPFKMAHESYLSYARNCSVLWYRWQMCCDWGCGITSTRENTRICGWSIFHNVPCDKPCVLKIVNYDILGHVRKKVRAYILLVAKRIECRENPTLIDI